jgi:hypothetical protein
MNLENLNLELNAFGKYKEVDGEGIRVIVTAV